MWLEHGLRGWPLLLKYSLISCKELYLMVHAHRQFQTRASSGIAWVQFCSIVLIAYHNIVLRDNGADPSDSKDNRPV